MQAAKQARNQHSDVAMLKTTIGVYTFIWNPKMKDLLVYDSELPGTNMSIYCKTLDEAEYRIADMTDYDGIIVWHDVE